MTSHDESRVAHSSWGFRDRGRWPRSFPGLLDGTVLLLAWVALWTVFVLGVLEPASRFINTNAAGPAAQVERSRT
ncbi:MAG TPA: hypothetical protein VFF02_16525 [Anaeromyxobacteraceae bacterium]|nr:hypothetical protein [Anaeromyxobacteraceae bacterium]